MTKTGLATLRRRTRRCVRMQSVTYATCCAEVFPGACRKVAESTNHTYSRTKLLSRLKELIDSELTERQWTALTAELGGMPLPQLAEKLDSNTNSIYKLLHDARKKLRRGLEASGFTVEDVREAWA